jgi:Phage tail sheath protein subtilisin-like domain/Phage tail sheath C-terminal domain
MAEMILPGVYIEERPEALIVAGPITVGNIGIVGTAKKGPLGEVTILSSFADAIDNFGAYDKYNPDAPGNELTLSRALELAYANGASTVYAIRISGMKDQDAADKDNFIAAWDKNTKAQKATFSVAGETAGTEAAKLNAINHGSWGNEIGINVSSTTADSFVSNEEFDVNTTTTTIALKRVNIDAASSRNQIKLVKADGQAKIFNLVYPPQSPNPGDLQIDPATGTLTFAAGETPVKGDKLYASYAVKAANSRQVTIRYAGVTETYNVADGTHLVDLVNDKNSGSALVQGGAGANPGLLPRADSSIDVFKLFGSGANISGNNGQDNVNSTEYETGLEQLLNENVHIIIAAGQSGNDTDISKNIGTALQSHVAEASNEKTKRERIAVVGGSKITQPNNVGHNLDSDRVVFVAPGIITTDASSGKAVTLPGAYAAAAIAGMLSAASPHVSLTNKTVSVNDLEIKFNPSQLEQLILSRVLATEIRQGIRVVKAITTSTNTAFQQITTRRIVDYAKYGVRSAANPYIGLLNNDRVRKTLKGSINGFLAGMVDDEMLIGYQLDVTATRDEQIRGIARVTMTIQPTFSIDYIKVVMYLG